MIIIKNLHKTFPKRFIPYQKKEIKVLKGIDATFKKGEIVGVVGNNGVGKTTLFRVIAGLEVFEEGEVSVLGFNPSSKEGAKKLKGKVALLPEEPGLSQLETAKDHLFIFGFMMGLSEFEIKERMEKFNQTMDIFSYWDRAYRGYSKGQKAKISMARIMLMTEAEVFIFDEPTNGMDFNSAKEARNFIRNLAKNGKIIIVASHILPDLINMCDKIIGIDDGKIIDGEIMKNKMSSFLLDYENQLRSLKEQF